MGCFSPAEVHALAVGEQSGALVQTLNLLADHHARIDQHRKKLRAAVTYPLMLLVIAPILSNVPALITDDISLGRYLFKINLLPALLLGGSVLARATWRRHDQRRAVISMLQRVPGLGPMLRQYILWRFLSSARILIGTGVGIRTAFRELAVSSSDAQLAAAIQTWEENLESGMSLADSLYGVAVFDAETRQLLGNAALAGRLEDAIETLTAMQAIAMSSRVQLLYTLLPTVSIFGVLLLLLLRTAF